MQGYITVINSPQESERKTVTVTELFVVSKKEQHQWLHYSN